MTKSKTATKTVKAVSKKPNTDKVAKKAADSSPQKVDKFVKGKFIDGARILASTVSPGPIVRFMASNGCRYALPREEYDSLPKSA